MLATNRKRWLRWAKDGTLAGRMAKLQAQLADMATVLARHQRGQDPVNY